MNLNQPTLVAFEKERLENGFIPPYSSNSFYNIGSGVIDIYCISNHLIYYNFDIRIKNGTIHIGNGDFTIDNSYHYHSMVVDKNTSLINDGNLYINNNVDIYGSLTLKSGSTLSIASSGNLIIHPDSDIIIEEGANIIIEDGSFSIYGRINVDLSLVDNIINNDGIYVDSSAVLVVNNIDLGDREYSMTDYELDLRDKIINKYTQGEYNFPNGRVGYIWKGGNPDKGSQIIELDVLYGDVTLGDFKLPILGTQNDIIDNLQITQSLRVRDGSTLYISDSYNDYQYIRPELYLGMIIDNCKEQANCRVEGNIVVSGVDSKITIDRGATLTVEDGGFIYLENGGYINSTNNSGTVLFINGTIVADTIEQIQSLESYNIEFGENGKVIILNKYEDDHKILFSTPNGIKTTDLYRIFENTIDHVEYHIQENCGIYIDEYFEFYARDMTNWYGGMRIEKAIHDGLIIWHNNGFIELRHDIIPWATLTCSLLQASRIFKTFGSYDNDKLQEAIERLRYAGCGNITFRYIEGEEYNDIILVMDDINMRSITNAISSDDYILDTDNIGELFMKNSISDTSASNIIDNNAKIVHLNNGETQFSIP